jgi:glycosyltransferase involved in cell wall biosynthesis
MAKKILFLSKGDNASSTRYRALQYFPILQEGGWQPSHHRISGGFIAFITGLFLARQMDVVVLLRKTFPLPIFWLLRFFCKKIIFDFDDAIFCNTDGSFSATRMARFKQTVAASDYIFAGNSYLANTARQFNPKVSVIPTSVDTNKYKLTSHKDSTRITLVWIGSKSTKKYIEAILPCIDQLACKIPSLELKIIADFKLEAKNLIIHNIKWQAQTEAQNLVDCHIGLAPLPEDDWTKGKCGLKVLQYMAAGLPVITSDTGVNREFVVHGVNGYVVTGENWGEAIEKATSNMQSLDTFGLAGQAKARDIYDIIPVSNKLKSLLFEVFSQDKKSSLGTNSAN